MYIQNLVIEVTRKCNMSCAHCLRGNAQNVNIDKRAIDEILLHSNDGIDCLTFTGGEPTLNLDAIAYTFQEIKRLGISLGSFYVVTNGRVYRQRLIDMLDEMYEYCYDKDLCGLAVSDDIFHRVYQSGSFKSTIYRYMYDEYDCEREYFRLKDKQTDFYRVPLISEGRATLLNNYDKRENKPSPYIDDLVHIDGTSICGTLYLNALGDLIDGCDWSYSSQNKFRIASVFEWDKFLIKIPAQCMQ